MITVSVPAKIHLLGEHSVVYGKPALLAAINRRISVTIKPSKTKIIQGCKGYEKEIGNLLHVLERAIMEETKIKKIKSYSIKINSQIPVRAGLGSSAALSAAFTAGLLSFLDVPWDKKTIFKIAYAGETFFHGNPSGGDLAIVIEGGFLWFRKEFEFLKTFSILPFKLHENIKQFVLINSGKPEESTKELVENVSKLKIAFPKKAQSIFNSQEELTKRMVIALRDGNEDNFIECIKFGEKNLEELGVVGKKAQTIIRGVEELGGAAKISGGGGIKKGSGMLLAYHKDMGKIINYVKQNNLELLSIKIEEKGLKINE